MKSTRQVDHRRARREIALVAGAPAGRCGSARHRRAPPARGPLAAATPGRMLTCFTGEMGRVRLQRYRLMWVKLMPSILRPGGPGQTGGGEEPRRSIAAVQV